MALFGNAFQLGSLKPCRGASVCNWLSQRLCNRGHDIVLIAQAAACAQPCPCKVQVTGSATGCRPRILHGSLEASA